MFFFSLALLFARNSEEKFRTIFVVSVQRIVIDASLQESFQVLQHLLRRGCRSVSLNRLAILVDNELGEVPFDAVEEHAALLLLQVLPQRMGCLAVHLDLVEQIELDFAIGDKALDLFGVAGFLMVELIARESENAKTWRRGGKGKWNHN